MARRFVIVVACAFIASVARADERAYTATDREVDEALGRARSLESQGLAAAAGEEYAKVEVLVAKKREKDPEQRIVTATGPETDKGVVHFVRERVRGLPKDGLAAYRSFVEPKARQALEAAIEEDDLDAIETVAERWPLSSSAERALQIVGADAFERGDVSRAQRAFDALAGFDFPREELRRIAFLRLCAAVARGDARTAQAALDSYVANGGDAAKERLPLDGKVASPLAAVEALRGAEASGPRAVDPGRLLRTFALANPELPVELAARVERVNGLVPAYQVPVWDADTKLLLVQDGKTLRAIDLEQRGRGWVYTTAVPRLGGAASEPGRLEVSRHEPGLGAGRVFATFHRNLPAQRQKRAPGAPPVGPKPANPPKPNPPKPGNAGKKDQDEDEIVRLPDWRVVALDRASGRFLWDAADDPGFQDIARDAEWVSSPVEHAGQVLVTVLLRKGADLRAYLVSLEASSGKPRYRAFLASRSPYDFFGLGSPIARPVVQDGKVYVATSLGVAACLDPARGEVLWLARYACTPERSQPEIVRLERRFRATPPIVGGDEIVLVPVDAQEVIALDARTGERRWSTPRGDAVEVAPTPSGDILLAGNRPLLLDRKTGVARFRGEPFGSRPIAPPLASKGKEDEALVPLATSIARVSLKDGHVLSRFRWENATLEAGWLAWAGDERIATASWSRLNLYEDVSVSETLASGQRNLILGETAARRGEIDRAGDHLERAAQDAGLSLESRARARQLAFAALGEQAARARAQGDAEAFLSAARRALVHGDQLLKEVLRDRRPLEGSLADLANRVATLRRLYADALATKDVPSAKLAVGEYEKLLGVAPGTLVSLDDAATSSRGPLRVEARAYAKHRLRELVKSRGREVYAPQDKLAAESVRSARSTGTKEGFERVAREWPASAHLGDALWELHRYYLMKGLDAEAAVALEQLVDELPDNKGETPDADAHGRILEALARLARIHERLHRPAKARRAAAELARRASPTENVRGGDEQPVRPATALAAEIARRTQEGDPDALAAQDDAADIDIPLQRVFRSTTELSASGGELVLAENEALAPRDRYLVRRLITAAPGMPGGNGVIEARSVDSGIALATFDAPSSLIPKKRWFGWSGGSFIVPAANRITAYDALTGAPRWVTLLSPPPGRAVIGPDDVMEIAYGESVVVVQTRWSEILGIDATNGAVKWKHGVGGREAGGGLLARGSTAILVGDRPARLEALDLATGNSLWTWQPDVAPGVFPSLSAARFVGQDALAAIISAGGVESQQLILLELESGNMRWRATNGGYGWFGDEILPAPNGRAVVVRGPRRVGAGVVFWVFATASGKELWHDDGFGGVHPGPRPEAQGALPALDDVCAGETAVYTFRRRAGATEVWAQDLTSGTLDWTYEAPRGVTGPTTIIETPATVAIARDGRFDRASVIVLGKGTGRQEQQLALPGRKFIGRGIVVKDGVLVASTDRGTFGLARVNEDKLARETMDAVLAVIRNDTPATRSELGRLLAKATSPRIEDAIEACSAALLSEGSGESSEKYDRLFAQLAALAESAIEAERPNYEVRRLPRPPEIDGELNDWWRGWSSIDMTGPRFVPPIQVEVGRPGRWNGPEDLSGRLSLGWDEKYFYFAIDVMDADLRPYDSENPRWIGDCLLIAIDCKNDGGYWFNQDDVLLSLALTLPKKKKDEEQKDPQQQQDEEQNKPDGKYFVKRKDDGSGAIYEAQIPWSLFTKNGVDGLALDPVRGPQPGFTFGFNLILTDDDGDRLGPQDVPAGVDPKDLPEGRREGDFRGALKSLQLTPSVLLHERKERLWQGYIPEHFAKITLK